MNNTKEYGYIRVSSIDQNIDRQFIPLLQLGISRNHIYVDKISGKDFNRKQYQKLRKVIKSGDTIYIKSIDRLGRNYQEIISEWQYITKDKNADICILDMPILDTRKNKDLIGTFISDIVLYLLSYVAEQEREFNKIRQAEGIAAARLRGVHLGRVADPLPEELPELYEMYMSKEISVKESMQILNVDRNRFYYLIKKYREINNI